MTDKYKVLIVDDRIENLISLERVLSQFQIEFVRATSGNEALTYCISNDFALAILDVQMPEMDGFELLEYMREEERTKHVPVLFLSAIFQDETHILKGIETGAVDFIPKPINPQILVGKVKVLLDLYDHQHRTEALVKERTEALEKMNEQLKIEREKAIVADRLKSSFLANMSHEIRTPLNGILGMSEMIERVGELNEQQKDYMNTLQGSGEDLLLIINDILDFSKIESGKLEIENIDFNLPETILTTQKMFVPKAEEKGIAFNINIGAHTHKWYHGDPHRIKQVIINLVNNAIKFTKKGSVNVEVSMIDVEPNKTGIVFKVIDSGIGISKEQQKGLFTEFFQADATITRRFGGTGLGLTICQNLVTLMGGKISVSSEYGHGSTFAFELILEKATEQKEVAPTIISKQDHVTLRVLLAEDNPVNIKVAEFQLSRMGHQVIIAENGQKAVDEYKKDKFDLILMDIQMPILDGVGATKAIRKHEIETGANSVPIIAITACAIKGDKERFLSAGMNGYISKPFKMNELQTTIAAFNNRQN